MPRPDETFIVRVRRREGDAVVEEPRVARRQRVREVAEVGALILRWLGSRDEHAAAQDDRDDGSRPGAGLDTERRAP
jgi:hypothetical protein